MGYAIAVLGQFAAAFCTCLYCSSVVSFLIGSCLLLTCIAKDVSIELSIINNSEICKETTTEMKKRFCDVVQLHADAKQLSGNQIYSLFSEVYEFDSFYFKIRAQFQ